MTKTKEVITTIKKAVKKEHPDIEIIEPKKSDIPAPPPTRKDREIALKEMEIQTLKDFMGGKHQNTHISRDERLLLSILYHDLARNPWAISKRVCEDLGIPFNDSEFEIDFLKDFIADYLDFGLPIDRMGRDEMGKIFEAYFRGDEKDKDKKDEKLIT